jgi:hypothetical protein
VRLEGTLTKDAFNNPHIYLPLEGAALEGNAVSQEIGPA